MLKIALFCEDAGHELFLEALAHKIAAPDEIQIKSFSSRGGKGKALSELEVFLRDMQNGIIAFPDAIIVAIDANCRGYQSRRREIEEKVPQSLKHIAMVYAIPDPHIERWLLVDSHAFKLVFGRGCPQPDLKCEKDRYKKLLRDAILATGSQVLLGGIENAEALVAEMEIERVKKLDDSLKQCIVDLQQLFKK